MRSLESYVAAFRGERVEAAPQCGEMLFGVEFVFGQHHPVDRHVVPPDHQVALDDQLRQLGATVNFVHIAAGIDLRAIDRPSA